MTRALILAGLAAMGAVVLHQAHAARLESSHGDPAEQGGQGDPFAAGLADFGDAGQLARSALDNIGAFLAMISHAEGTNRGDPYRVLFGGQQWSGSLHDHPANLGWSGLKLPDHQCRAAGFGPGCVSTAAGRYQIIKPTYARLARSCPFPGFTPAAQDWMAGELLRENGALHDVEEGRFAQAVAKVRRVWASMPGAGYAQPEKTLAALQTAYINAGGTVA